MYTICGIQEFGNINLKLSIHMRNKMYDKFSVNFHCNIKIINFKHKHIKINKIHIYDVIFFDRTVFNRA